jgi:endonuclease/exonuclease/phosphatase family metal-dependent hydrolase
MGTHNVIIAGDFNATLTGSDRATGKSNPMDLAHRDHIKKGQLHALDPPTPGQPRQYTWRQGAAEQAASRIDDIFTNNRGLLRGVKTRVWDKTGSDSDHDLLEACIPYAQLNMRPPPPDMEGLRQKSLENSSRRRDGLAFPQYEH